MITGMWKDRPCQAIQCIALDDFADVIEELGPTEYDVKDGVLKIKEPWQVEVEDNDWLLRHGNEVMMISNEDWVEGFVLDNVQVPPLTFKKDPA